MAVEILVPVLFWAFVSLMQSYFYHCQHCSAEAFVNSESHRWRNDLQVCPGIALTTFSRFGGCVWLDAGGKALSRRWPAGSGLCAPTR